jgi:hypothetical protein
MGNRCSTLCSATGQRPILSQSHRESKLHDIKVKFLSTIVEYKGEASCAIPVGRDPFAEDKPPVG